MSQDVPLAFFRWDHPVQRRIPGGGTVSYGYGLCLHPHDGDWVLRTVVHAGSPAMHETDTCTVAVAKEAVPSAIFNEYRDIVRL